MKNLLLLLMTNIAFMSYGQVATTSRIGLYKWKDVVLIQPSDINGDADGSSEIMTKVEQKFRVVKILDGGKVLIQVLDYTKEINDIKKTASKSAEVKLYNAEADFFKYNFKGTLDDYTSLSADKVNSRNYGLNQAYFTVDLVYIDDCAIKEERIGGALTVGVMNLPFKYRPQKGNADFTGAFNFGVAIGYKFPHKSWRNFTHSIISGYSISNIVLDSSSTNKNQLKLASTNNFSAFSFSVGYLVEYQRVQAILSFGWDYLSKVNQRQFDWQYQAKPWISVGFGVAIFSDQKEKESKNPQKEQSH